MDLKLEKTSDGFFLVGKNGKKAALRYKEERKKEDGDLDRISCEFELDSFPFADPDDLSKSDLKEGASWGTLFMTYSHDSYDGKHERVLEDSTVRREAMSKVIEFLGSEEDAHAVFRMLAKASTFPEGFDMALAAEDE